MSSDSNKHVNFSLLKRKGEILARLMIIDSDDNFKQEANKLKTELEMLEKTLRSLNNG